MSAPAAIVARGSPPKVSRRFEPGTSAGPEARRPTAAAPMASGRVPPAFEMRTRRLPPPRLTRGIIRSVWLLKAAPSAGAGAAVHVPTQCAIGTSPGSGRIARLYSLTMTRHFGKSSGGSFSPSRDEDIDYQSRLLGTA